MRHPDDPSWRQVLQDLHTDAQALADLMVTWNQPPDATQQAQRLADEIRRKAYPPQQLRLF